MIRLSFLAVFVLVTMCFAARVGAVELNRVNRIKTDEGYFASIHFAFKEVESSGSLGYAYSLSCNWPKRSCHGNVWHLVDARSFDFLNYNAVSYSFSYDDKGRKLTLKPISREGFRGDPIILVLSPEAVHKSEAFTTWSQQVFSILRHSNERPLLNINSVVSLKTE